MKRFLFTIILTAAVWTSGCAAPDQYQMLESRVTSLESESRKLASKQEQLSTLDQIREEFEKRAKSNREQYAELKYEIEQVKQRFHMTEGLIEEIRHNFGSSDQARQASVEKQMERLDNAISQNYERIIALEKYMGFEPSQPLTSKGDAPAKDNAETADTEQGLYNLAKRMFDQGNTEGARVRFENFINKYPQSQNADNARFWIAESYYVEKWFEKAILEYQKVLESYPDSNKSAAARLKQGYAFAELGEMANARLILKELIKRNPDSNEAKYAAEKLKNLNE